MTQYEVFVLVLCIIIYVLLASLSTVLLTIIARQKLKLIKSGAEDEQIIKQYKKNSGKERKKCGKFDMIVSILLCTVFFVLFACSVFINANENSYSDVMPTLRVVKSGSMEKKHEQNTYLFENDINNQIDTFDLIFTYKVPGEYELELYDIVVYEVDGVLLVHRIVDIEEPNENHPHMRYFLCQGDAVSAPDRFPVLYGQMRGIYRNERIPFIGSFITFLQSPVGWMCIILILVAMIATPIIEKAFEKATKARILFLIKNGRLTKEELNVKEEKKKKAKVKTESTPKVVQDPLASFGNYIPTQRPITQTGYTRAVVLNPVVTNIKIPERIVEKPVYVPVPVAVTVVNNNANCATCNKQGEKKND